MRIVAVILAGGAGSRIGGAKPSRMLAGRTLLERAAAHAGKWSDRVAVAVRGPGQAAGVGLPLLFDHPGIDGPLAGLAAGLRFVRDEHAEAVLTLPADMPFLPADLSERLQGAINGRAAAIASSGGRLHPVCGLWRTVGLEEIADYVARGGRSLRGFAEAMGFAAVEWLAAPVDPFFNINNAEDLAAAERLLGN